jgi:hypothetical protein
MGMFTFAEIEPLCSDDFWEAETEELGRFCALLDHTADCLSENVIILGKARGYSLSSLYNISLRILRIMMFFGGKDAETVFSQSFLRVIEKTDYLNIKSAIPLKLRI